MPVVDPGILAGARSAIEVLLKLSGQEIVLQPSTAIAIEKPGGGHDFMPDPPRDPQKFALRDTGAGERQRSNNDDGLSRKRVYALTGRTDAVVAVGDTWYDDTAEYIVETVDATSGYKTACEVSGYLKGIGHGPH